MLVGLEVTHPTREMSFAIRASDWSRIKNIIGKLARSSAGSSAWWPVLFGVSPTCVTAALPLFYATGVPPCIAWVFLGAGAVSGIFGGFSFVRDKDDQRRRDRDISEAEAEVGYIDASFDQS